MAPTTQLAWWQTGVVYQIYPRSFMDSNGDGIGDLPGITSKLDYVAWLGADAIWLSPIYPSPMADFGYDISDYTGIHPLFGTLVDFDALLQAAHARNLRVLLDLVPNHTSDEHPWFLASRSSRDHPQRDWYIWRDPAAGGGPPTNWQSTFGGSAWERDDRTGQYYLHLHDRKQPDLNWRNPEVRRAIFDVVRFWLDRGVDGFRVDALGFLLKPERFVDDPPNPAWRPGDLELLRQVPVHLLGEHADPQDPIRREVLAAWHRSERREQGEAFFAALALPPAPRPELHAIVRELRAVVDAYPERVVIGELLGTPELLASFYGANLDEIHLPFNFLLGTVPWRAEHLRTTIERYLAALPPGAWPNWVLGNHDMPRLASRTGTTQVRVAQMLLLTLRGTPTMYYGDELGMHNVAIPPELAQDPARTAGVGSGRDPGRTPMQWDGTANAGFTAGRPWLPLAADSQTVNVAVEQGDPRSLLTLVRTLLAVRRASPALRSGTFHLLDAGTADLLAYRREASEEHLLVALNLGAQERTADLGAAGARGTVLCSTHLDRQGTADLARLTLRPGEGLVLQTEWEVSDLEHPSVLPVVAVGDTMDPPVTE